jgi:WD40 repeat protein
MFPVFTSDGKRLLVLDAFARIHILLVPSLESVRTFQLKVPPKSSVSSIRLSPDNQLIAVLTVEAPSGGQLAVYDLSTGEEGYTWNFTDAYLESIRWFPDGRRLVVATVTTSGKANSRDTGKYGAELQVCDLTSQEVTPIHIGYPVGDLAFADNTHVFVAGSYPDEKVSLRLIDMQTGRIVREYPKSDSGVRYYVSSSPESDRVLAYIGKEKMKFDWIGLESTTKVIDQRFRIWNFKSGDVIATSPALKPLRPLALTIELSKSGKYVLFAWHGLRQSPALFKID